LVTDRERNHVSAIRRNRGRGTKHLPLLSFHKATFVVAVARHRNVSVWSLLFTSTFIPNYCCHGYLLPSVGKGKFFHFLVDALYLEDDGAGAVAATGNHHLLIVRPTLHDTAAL